MGLVPYNVSPEERKKILEDLLKEPEQPKQPAVLSDAITPLSNGNYVFTDIPYNAGIIPAVELCGRRLDNGYCHGRSGWHAFSLGNNDGWSVTTLEMLYQLLFRAYNLRDDPKYSPVVKELAMRFQDWFYPGGDTFAASNIVDYETVIYANLSSFGSFQAKPKLIQIPEFKQYQRYLYLFKACVGSYFTLANKQPECLLGRTCVLPQNIEDALQSLLGNSFWYAGEVFQYFSSRDNGDLNPAKSSSGLEPQRKT